MADIPKGNRIMPNKKRDVYLDNAATTKMRPEVLEAMIPYLTENYGNASAVYEKGRRANAAVENAREQVAKLIGAKKASDVYFTSGGTEGDNWAMHGPLYYSVIEEEGDHIITTKAEHHAVINTCLDLRKRGYAITFLNVDKYGSVSAEAVERAVRPDTVLISVMLANNEIGTINDIASISKVARDMEVLMHTDAVQAAGHIPIDVNELGVDMLTMSAHKFYGPKGVGALYIRSGANSVKSFMNGGSQEGARRAGTENVAGIVGMGKAAELAMLDMKETESKILELREHMVSRVLSEIPGSRLNGNPTARVPGNAHFTFEDITSEALLFRLDMAGVSCSAGAACEAGSLEPPHVLKAIGIPEKLLRGSLRFTIGRYNTIEDINYAVDVLAAAVKDLRVKK